MINSTADAIVFGIFLVAILLMLAAGIATTLKVASDKIGKMIDRAFAFNSTKDFDRVSPPPLPKTRNEKSSRKACAKPCKCKSH